MPRYYVNGKWYRSEAPLSPQDLEELYNVNPAPEEGPSGVESALKWANTPLWEGPSQFGRYVSGSDTRQANFGDNFLGQLGEGITQHPWETAKGFVQGGIEGLGNFASSLTTPLNLATMGAARGASTAAKMGLPGATQAFTWAGRALGAPQAYEGYQSMVNPDLPMASRVMGGVQAVGGLGQMGTAAPRIADPYRRGPVELSFEMEDAGNVPPGEPPPPSPPVRQQQRTIPPNFTPRALIPDITETFPYEEYTTPAPPAPTDPRISSMMDTPERRFAVDESGRHLGGYIGDEQTPAIERPIPDVGQNAAQEELVRIRAEVDAMKAQMRALEDAQLGPEPPPAPMPAHAPMQPQPDMPAPEPNPFQIEQRPQSTQLAGPEPIWNPTAPAQPIWPPNQAESRFPAFPNEPPAGPVQQPPMPPTGPPANTAAAIVAKIKSISKKKPPITPAPLPDVPPQPTQLPTAPPIQQAPPAPPVAPPQAPEPTLPPAPPGFADQVAPPTITDTLQGAAPLPRKAGGLRPKQKFTQPPAPYVAPEPTAPVIGVGDKQTLIKSILNFNARAADMSRKAITDPAQWAAIRAEMQPHIDNLRNIAKRGTLSVQEEDVLRNAGNSINMLEQQAAKNAKKGKFVPKTPTPEPTPEPAPNEPVIARSADQVHQLISEGYKVVSRTSDGGIVLEPPAQLPESEGARIAGKRKFDYGAARAKARELGIKLDRTARLADIHAAIKEKDPSWEPPTGSTFNEPPTESHEMPPRASAGGGGGNAPPPRGGGPTASSGPQGPPPGGGYSGGARPRGEPFRPGNVRYGARAIRPPEKQPWYKELYNLSRGLMSIDPPFITSAAFRQGLPWIGTKYWLQAWKNAFRSYGSKEAYTMYKDMLERDNLFAPQFRFQGAGAHAYSENSIAARLGLKLGDLTDEILTTAWAEKIPGWGRHVAGSNRAYNAFLNHLRAHTFKQLLTDSGIWDGRNITNEPLAREIAEFVNTTTGRGKLQFKVGVSQQYGKTVDFEQSAKRLTDILFSPRLIASRAAMLNPSTYLMANPTVRKEYAKAMLRTIGAWWTIASMLELAGGDVSKDPTNADYGKIRFGNTRIDPGGGFQQFLVAAARMTPEGMQPPPETGITPIDLALGFAGGGGGVTSSVSGQFNRFGEGYKPETRLSTLGRFAVSKLHPTLKLAVDILNASQREPVYLGDRLMQMAAPLMAGDLLQIFKEDPTLLPLAGITTGIGMGGQTYEGGVPDPQLMPESLQDYDIVFGGQ
jgi:hypothetical protein